MKQLIPGMFSSVTDAELIIATSGYDDTQSENLADKFSDNDDDSLTTATPAEINSSIVTKSTTNNTTYGSAINKEPEDSLQ